MQGTIARVEQGQIVEPVFSFSLNPTSINRTKNVKWVHHTAPGTSSSYAQFVSAGDQTIKLDIFLAAHRSNPRSYERERGVLPEIAFYELLTMPSADLFLNDDAQFIQPPSVILGLNERSWLCVVHDINITEEEFNDTLLPVRAKVSLTLKTKHDTFAGLRNKMFELWSDRAFMTGEYEE